MNGISGDLYAFFIFDRISFLSITAWYIFLNTAKWLRFRYFLMYVNQNLLVFNNKYK